MAKAQGSRAAHWRGVLETWRRSGLTVAAFCRRRRIAAPTFYVWKRRLGVPPDPLPAFLPVRVVPPSSRSVVELDLRGGRRLRLHTEITPDLIAGLVRALEGEAC